MYENREALSLLLNGFRARARHQISAGRRGYFTGKLYDSIDFEIFENNGSYTFEVSMEHYGIFIDAGVNGRGFQQKKGGGADRRFARNRSVVTDSEFSFRDKKPPINAIRPWAEAKGINPYALQNSIYTYGIKGVNFFEKILEQEIEHFSDYVAEIESQKLLDSFFDQINL